MARMMNVRDSAKGCETIMSSNNKTNMLRNSNQGSVTPQENNEYNMMSQNDSNTQNILLRSGDSERSLINSEAQMSCSELQNPQSKHHHMRNSAGKTQSSLVSGKRSKLNNSQTTNNTTNHDNNYQSGAQKNNNRSTQQYVKSKENQLQQSHDTNTLPSLTQTRTTSNRPTAQAGSSIIRSKDPKVPVSTVCASAGVVRSNASTTITPKQPFQNTSTTL